MVKVGKVGKLPRFSKKGKLAQDYCIFNVFNLCTWAKSSLKGWCCYKQQIGIDIDFLYLIYNGHLRNYTFLWPCPLGSPPSSIAGRLRPLYEPTYLSHPEDQFCLGWDLRFTKNFRIETSDESGSYEYIGWCEGYITPLKSLEIPIWNQKSRTSKKEIPLKNEKSRTLNAEVICPSDIED